MRLFFFILLLGLSVNSQASNNFSVDLVEVQLYPLVELSSMDMYESSHLPNTSIDTNVNKTKLIAISLAITLGAFGVHRLYLGTKPIVPVAYTLTLGGGFLILPLIDIFYIILAKDLDDIQHNNFVFMWNKKKKSEESLSKSP